MSFAAAVVSIGLIAQGCWIGKNLYESKALTGFLAQGLFFS
ncbi:hypothetical protein CSC17_1110 [Klebsiella oxytoca]|nr:hypothetical protein CSC17_1110 [Klebsiella oxytoca]